MAVLLAGQIGLVPRTMTLAPSSQQPSLSLRHSCSVLEANHSHLTSALCGTCYYTTEEAGWAARMTWIEVTTPPFTTLIAPDTHAQTEVSGD